MKLDYNNILVTVGIPNFNYARYVLQALNSVADQTFPHIEIIIVDDKSTDNSVEVINKWIKEYKGSYEVVFIQNENNLGLTKVCNLILNKAKGKYLQLLDADDKFLPAKIENQVLRMACFPDSALVYSNMLMMNQAGDLINENYLSYIGYDEKKMPEGKIFKDLFKFNFIAYPLINKQYAIDVGGFDEDQQVHDYYLWLKLSEVYDIRFSPGKDSIYRIHEKSMSNNNKTSVISEENVLKTKFRYYKNADDSIKNIIRQNLANSVPSLYEANLPSAGTWIRRNLILNPGIKAVFYFTAYHLKVPFSFIRKMQKFIKQ